MPPFFELIHVDKHTGARAGIMHTAHGDIPTPCFMPVGTQASVKALDATDMETLDAPIILANTYHLHLRPGADTIAKLGGLHKFMNWKRPILTDSGGFQIFSLGQKMKQKNNVILEEQSDDRISGDPIAPATPPLQDDGGKSNHGSLVEIDDDGVTFRSHVDGSEHRFTPETAIDIQHKLGADIIMAFDECTPDDVPREYVERALDRTHRWAERSVDAHQHGNTSAHQHKQFLFGIIQGSLHKDLREASAKFTTSLPFDGIAIGGESTGFNMEATAEILQWLAPILPEDKPRYTMGVGHKPEDLRVAVAGGADMFDCVSPTRMARNGTLFSGNNMIHIETAQFKEDETSIDQNCSCHTCQNYSRAYLHHLFKAKELSAFRLATIHNLHHILSYMRGMRTAILEDRFSSF